MNFILFYYQWGKTCFHSILFPYILFMAFNLCHIILNECLGQCPLLLWCPVWWHFFFNFDSLNCGPNMMAVVLICLSFFSSIIECFIRPFYSSAWCILSTFLPYSESFSFLIPHTSHRYWCIFFTENIKQKEVNNMVSKSK